LMFCPTEKAADWCDERLKYFVLVAWLHRVPVHLF
jgi:hypothetical protein